MSPSHSDLVREAVAAFNRRDYEALPRLFSPEIEFRESPEWPQAGVYRGLGAFAAYFSRLTEHVDDLTGEVLSTAERGDRVLADLRGRGRERATGNPVEVRITAIYTFQDGICVKLVGFLDREKALSAWRDESEP